MKGTSLFEYAAAFYVMFIVPAMFLGLKTAIYMVLLAAGMTLFALFGVILGNFCRGWWKDYQAGRKV